MMLMSQRPLRSIYSTSMKSSSLFGRFSSPVIWRYDFYLLKIVPLHMPGNKIRWSYCQSLNEPIIDEVLFFCASALQIKWIAMLSFSSIQRHHQWVLVSSQSVTIRPSTKGKQSAFWCPTGGLLISSSLTASLIERSIVLRRSHSLKRYTFKVKALAKMVQVPGLMHFHWNKNTFCNISSQKVILE